MGCVLTDNRKCDSEIWMCIVIVKDVFYQLSKVLRLLET